MLTKDTYITYTELQKRTNEINMIDTRREYSDIVK